MKLKGVIAEVEAELAWAEEEAFFVGPAGPRTRWR
jgi:hypothetical protein